MPGVRKVCLFTGQWADLTLEEVCEKAKAFGYDGLELACWGTHFEVNRAINEPGYIQYVKDTLDKHGLCLSGAISTHLVGQAVCDRIDERHKGILPERIYGDGTTEGVNARAAQEVKDTATAAKMLGVDVVNGFTGSSIWHLLYDFPPTPPHMIDEGYRHFAEKWLDILEHYKACGVKYALEIHPAEIAFDIGSMQRALEALNHHPNFGVNFDPSHLAYQNVDYVKLIYTFSDRIFNVHMKDVYISKQLTEVGTFGGHVPFGDRRRAWDFASCGRGSVDFHGIMRALNTIKYTGPLSIEWEDPLMDREAGATEACAFTKNLDYPPAGGRFDDAFGSK